MLAFIAPIFPGGGEYVACFLMVVIAAAPILVVIWFARKTLENKRENVKLRLEVGKLADELEQIRRQQQSE